MKKSLGFALGCCFFVFSTIFAAAQEKDVSYKLRARAERESAIYRKGEPVSFRISLEKDGEFLAGKPLHYTIQGDGNFETSGTVSSAVPFAVVETALDHPGFLQFTVRYNEENSEHPITSFAGAGVDPLEIRSQIPEPEDFEEFWNAQKRKLAEDPMNPVLVPVDPEKISRPEIEVFDIKVNCPGGKPISGYFAKPKNAASKSLPIIISYHGAGVYSSSMPVHDAARGALALDLNAHGIENGKSAEFYKNLAENELKDYRSWSPDDLENNYFFGMYLRVIRSLQFMKSQPEWDGKNILVKGSSQGAGQSLVAAGIEPDVKFCAAYVPALCYLNGSLEGNFSGWPGYLRGKTKETADPNVVKTVGYLDASNFAKRIRAECVLTTGFIDFSCPPTSTYITLNNIPETAKEPVGEFAKQIINNPEIAHANPKETVEQVERIFWNYFESVKKKP